MMITYLLQWEFCGPGRIEKILPLTSRGISHPQKELLCIHTTQLTHTMFCCKHLGSQVAVIRSDPELLLTFQGAEPGVPGIGFRSLLGLAGGMLAAEAEWPSFLIHSLNVAFGWGWLNSEISWAGIQRLDAGSVKLSTIKQNAV